ncbi:uncharacterized protein LOC128764662 isoform X2 [Synchiropus splendidus]|uniref:uncharacterized protein LOC128764662 isoform X2 n=1 Tax=Synchiropus splendidus TaxID=270530 RepID=UPI00237DF47A|nr:uncharacterized protein LOC128764662 isoform X2 [Synchiropus splendidus]
MGQLFSSETDVAGAREAIGSLLYQAMQQEGAVARLAVDYPLLLEPHEGSADRFTEQLKQLQVDLGSKAPVYLRDLIGRLTSFAEEPRLAGLLGLVVTVVIDMLYSGSRQTSASKAKSGPSSVQKVVELQELMEEYLKRCQIHLSDRARLIQDSQRLEAQLSMSLTQLKTCLLAGDCDSRLVTRWAKAAAFHTQMLVHLAALEDQPEPLAARAALDQYQEALTRILAAYRSYKSKSVHVVKCRSALRGSPGEALEEGCMTGLTVSDRETGKSATVSLDALQEELGRRGLGELVDLDQIPSDQYLQAYLDHLFSTKGPGAELQDYFSRTGQKLRCLQLKPESRASVSEPDGGPAQTPPGECLMLSIMETMKH